MGKIIRLTESDLTRIVRRVISEQSSPFNVVNLGYKLIPGYDGAFKKTKKSNSKFFCTVLPKDKDLRCVLPTGTSIEKMKFMNKQGGGDYFYGKFNTDKELFGVLNSLDSILNN